MIGLRIQIQGNTTKGVRYLVDFPLGDGSGEGATRCRSVQRQRVLLHVDRGGVALLKYGINGADWGTGIYRAVQFNHPPSFQGDGLERAEITASPPKRPFSPP